MVTDPLIGRVVDSRYEVDARVARGGMATVYRARDRRLDRVVALKLMHPHLADSPNFVARFRREARAAARLSNPGVVAVYDQGSLDGIAYLVMELVEGPNLRDLIAAGPLSVREALGLTAQILRPLGAAHRAGLVHRDVKPENVLLPSDGSVAKVADFGLARAVTEATQTTTGNVLGTVAYLAPELITAGASGPRADVYSVGVILYELLTGRQPFEADSPIQIAFRNVHEDVPVPSTAVPEIAAEVDELVAVMTARDPERRPADADAALVLLRAAMADLTESELSVRRGGGTASLRTQEVLAANARAARDALAGDAPASAEGRGSAPPPPREEGPGLRTVSFPIGSIGPGPGATGVLARQGSAVGRDAQATVGLHGVRRRRRSRRAVLAAAVVMLAAGTATSGWYLLKGPGRLAAVPAVLGMEEASARTAVEAEELAWAEPERAYSDTVAKGLVISCEPSPGSRLHLHQPVTVVVSLGVEQKTVPEVAGSTEDAARAAIVDAGLTVGAVTQAFSDTVASGSVISSTPEAGAVVNHSTAVALVVSKGRQPATVPDVTGMTVDEATAALTAAGLTLGSSSEEYSDTVAEGGIISSSPAAGADGVFRGDAVDVVVSKGPEMVAVPSVQGMSESEARKALEDAGLQVTTSDVLGGLFGTAHSTDPKAGEKVRKGSTVTLYVV